MRIHLFLLFFMLLFFRLPAGDMLNDGGFENTPDGKNLRNWSYNWRDVKHQLDAKDNHSGKYSLLMPPLPTGFYALTAAGGKIADFPAELIIRGMVKYDNLTVGRQMDGKNYYAPFVGIWTNTTSGANSFTIPAVKFTSGSRDWFAFEQRVTREEIMRHYNALPPKKRPATWALRLNFVPQPGTIRLDDLQLLNPALPTPPAIVYAAPDSPGESQAVKDLARCMQKITGRAYRIISPRQYDNSPGAIFIGPEAAQKCLPNFTSPKLDEEEWLLKSCGENFLITGGRPRGVAYGIYEFLEKYGKCLWLDFDTEIIPPDADFRFPATEERAKPAFSRREMYTASPQNHLFRFRNKENMRTSFPGFDLNIGSPNGCHTFAIYAAKWKDPALRATTKSGTKGLTQLCLTNPRTEQLVIKQLKDYIKADRKRVPPAAWPRIYDISQDDGGAGGECHCPGCAKVLADEDNRYSGVNNRFINRISAAIRSEYPDIKIRTFAYSYTQLPPAKVVAGDNVLIQSCNSQIFAPLLPGTKQGDILAGWKPFAANIAIWAYWKPYVGFEYPYVKPLSEMNQELRFCQANGVCHMFIESEMAQKRSFFQLQHFLALKLMQNPALDAVQLADKFFPAYYGAASPAMRNYYNYLEKRQLAATQGKATWQYLDEDFYRQSNKYLNEAEKAVGGDPLSLRHVRQERIPVDESMLTLWSELSKKFAMPDRGKLIDRYASNVREIITNTYGASWRKQAIAAELRELDYTVQLFRRLPAPLPQQFADKDIVDLHWKDFSPYSDHIERCLTPDPDSVCGMAFRVPDKHIDAAKHKRSGVHILPFQFGLWDPPYKIAKGATPLQAKDIPQDEKYHWYRVGTAEIHPSTIIYLHWSWMCQIYLRKAAVDIIPPRMEIFISLKFAGPAYVKNSTAENNVFADRVILVRQ